MYDDSTLAAVGEQLERVADRDFYAEKFADAGVDPTAVDSWADFRSLPFTTAGELEADFEAAPPSGSLYDGAAMVTFSPMGEQLRPVFDTADDLEAQAAANADVLERAGVEPGDRVVNTFGYELFGTGYVLHRALERLGAEVFPLGPGDSEQAAATIEAYDVDAVVGNPSFALKIGAEGGSVDTFVGAGEPFTSIPGRREAVKDALDASTAVDYFGTRHIMPVAAETAAEDGLCVVDDYAVVEVVDPDTGEVLDAGKRGEVVVTHLRKAGVPLVRYRTGDLAELAVRDGTVVLPDGVIGRTDERLKVKGVKVYPESIETVLAGFEGLTGEYRVEVSQPETTDHLVVICEGEADADELRAALGDRLIVTPDAVELVADLDEPGVVDERY
ncbi:phenylacetate--CoA ligase family protein [Halorubrum ezzemoulense]|uniref:phenylacetate--CoA ligase family protein n=1 Tax=Halorubrum ezzemoulense TaxID=337243 RepID=UPI00232D7503|nr:phenylacetate--CoA ligase family protein [Halorubrum ezzemoulense]MDB2224136.1 phenylacetate--CoA ligase family protein [Halorubrum ezzemoulense]